MPISSTLKKLADNTIELLTTIPLSRVKEEYQKVLAALQKTTEVAGFRKGKAPQVQVEKKVGKEKIYDETIKNLLPQIYSQVIKDHKLSPIVNPKINLISAQEGKDWQVKFITCEMPKVGLGDYKEKIKSLIAKNKIWTPSSKEKTVIKKAQLSQKIIAILEKTAKITLPQILIENELNLKLTNLIEKTEKLGLSLEQYLSSLGKTADQIKAQYQKEVAASWSLELALNKIADLEKIIVNDEDVNQFIKKAKSEQEKKQLANQRYVLSSMLRRRKTLEFLQNL